MKAEWFWFLTLCLMPMIPAYDARKKTKSRPFGASITDVLWKDYDPLFRPGEMDGGGTTVVDFSVGIEDIVYVKEGTMGASVNFLATVTMSWDDPRLAWKTSVIPREKLHIPARKLWTPDIRLIFNLEPHMELDYKIRATIASTGRVTAEVPAQLLVHCGRPQDSRANWECSLSFSSWSYDMEEIDLNLVGAASAQLSNYDDRVWLITGNSATKVIRNAGGVNHHELSYSIKILRR